MKDSVTVRWLTSARSYPSRRRGPFSPFRVKRATVNDQRLALLAHG